MSCGKVSRRNQATPFRTETARITLTQRPPSNMVFFNQEDHQISPPRSSLTMSAQARSDLRSIIETIMCTIVRSLFLCLLLVVGAAAAHADLTQWVATVNAGSPHTYLAIQISPLPTTISIGALSGNITYEFIVNGQIGPSSSGALMADGTQAIKFDQYPNTGLYGATQYGIADYNFGTATTVGTDVVLDFVANSGTGTTALFVNGANTGMTVPFALTLGGSVTVGGAYNSTQGFFDDFNGQILGLATFDSALSANEIKADANAFAAVPEPGCLAIVMGLGSSLCAVGSLRRSWKQS